MVDKTFLASQVRAVLDATPDLTTVTERGIRDQVSANNPTLDVNANKALIKETIKEVFIKVVGERSKAASADGRCVSADNERDRADGDEVDADNDEEEDGSSSDSDLEHATNRERESKKKRLADGSSSSAGGAKKPVKTRRRKRVQKLDGVKREPNPNNSFNAPKLLSEQLAALVGAKELSRPQIVKALWDYIKKNDLQDKADKRYIVCDARLASLFQIDRVHMFTMNKLIGRHIVKNGKEAPPISPPPAYSA